MRHTAQFQWRGKSHYFTTQNIGGVTTYDTSDIYGNVFRELVNPEIPFTEYVQREIAEILDE